MKRAFSLLLYPLTLVRRNAGGLARRNAGKHAEHVAGGGVPRNAGKHLARDFAGGGARPLTPPQVPPHVRPLVPRSVLCAALLAVLLGTPGRAFCAGITVSAATSLSAAFTEIARDFRAATGLEVRMNFASSNTLLRQIHSGAPADVFASADQAVMEEAAAPASGMPLILPATLRSFAANQLVLITPAAGRPAPGLDSLRDPAFSRIAIGTPESVPAGRYARRAMERAGLWDALAPRLIFGNNVRQVLTYVQRGEADAGIVYRTDALSAGDSVRLDAELTGQAAVSYPIAVTCASSSPDQARRFIDYVLSPAGQGTLARFGFSPLR